MYKPLEIKLMEIAGVLPTMKAMRLPLQSTSDSFKFDPLVLPHLGDEDQKLAGKLIRAGDDHAKALRGIVVWLEMKMQVGFMVEFETYRHGIECLSTSSTMHTNLKQLSGPALAEKKQAGLEDLVYTRILTISYQAFRSMYLARRYHRHPDWRVFCEFVEDLPYFKELIHPNK